MLGAHAQGGSAAAYLRTRKSQESTEESGQFYRSERSWAYDWFGPPAYHLHSPVELHRWLPEPGAHAPWVHAFPQIQGQSAQLRSCYLSKARRNGTLPHADLLA